MGRLRNPLARRGLDTLLVASALCVNTGASAAVNLLFNGSFEQTSAAPGATPGLAGWTIVPDYSTTPPGTVTYGQPLALFAAPVPADTAASPSPDPVGQRGFYLVDDTSPEAITQLLHLSAGSYISGFDYFIPTPALNGARPADATLWFKLESGPLWQANLQSLPQGSWQHLALNFSLPSPSSLHVVFDTTPYGSAARPALDVVIDRAFVTAVPEASTLLMMVVGLGTLVARRGGRHSRLSTSEES
jgi:sulfur relay (sulfurtransferase) DsrF/TusC family protein